MALLSRYQHVKLIGEGSFAHVQSYQTKDSGHLVAIKRLKPEHYQNADYVHRFCREVEILQQLANHPNVINLLDYSLSPELYAYVMPQAATNLQKYIERKNNSLETKYRLLIFEKILDAIQYAHQNNILHRDISPNNVLLFDNAGRMDIKVSDFGLGKSIDSYSALTHSSISSYGHFYYVAPEQREKLKSATFKSDIYSLGKLLNFILSGRIPEVIHSSDFTPVIRMATEYEPENRYSSIDEFCIEYRRLRDLVTSAALPIKIELEKLVNSRQMDWQRVHRSLIFEHQENDVYEDYLEPALLLLSNKGALEEYYQVLGRSLGQFVAKFAQKIHDLPSVGWPFSAKDDFGLLFQRIYILAKEPEIKLECLKGLWHCGYVMGQHAVQLQISEVLEGKPLPPEIHGEFADYIIQSEVRGRRQKVPYADLAKINLPTVVRNAIIAKSA